MKTFLTLAQPKKDIETSKRKIEGGQYYISLIENYKLQTFTQHVIHKYAHEGTLIRTAKNLNRLGHSTDVRKVESQDISNIIKIQPVPNDLLPKEVLRLYLKKIHSRS